MDTFAWCESIKQVIIEASVTGIGGFAFGRCRNLEKVELPSTLKRIEYWAFYGCFNLREIALPEGLEYIGSGSFGACVLLEEFYIPSTVSNIEMKIFEACSSIEGEYSLKNIYVSPQNVNYQSIDGVVYSKDGTEVIWYPEGRKDSSYTVCDGTVKIGKAAFGNKFIQTIRLPETVKTLGESAFAGAYNLENINIPEKLEIIDSCAFHSCWRLKKLVIPESVTYIGYWAFANCIALTDIYIYNYNVNIEDNVTIHAGTEILPPYIFYDCQPDLRVHIYEGSTVDYCMEDYDIGIKVYDLPHLYVICFDGNGDYERYMDAMNCIYGYEYQLNANKFKRTGYTFSGWNTKKDGSGISYKDKAIVKDLTSEEDIVILYAQWEKIEKCTVKFNANGGKNLSQNTISVIKNEQIGKLPKTAKKGYDFKGWYTKKSGGKKIDNTTVIKSNCTLYAHWKETEYELKYILGKGGKNHKDNPLKYTITTKTMKLKKPVRKGYQFSGWYSDKKYKNKINEIRKGTTGDKTIYAKWTANKYSIIFVGNGSTSGKMKPLSGCKYEKTYTLTSNKYEKKYHTFAGWNTEEDGSGKSYDNNEKVKNLTVKANGKVTLYAQWKKTDYPIEYNLNP